MTRAARSVVALTLGLLGACTNAPAPVTPRPAEPKPARSASYRVVDATGPFFEFWQRHEKSSPDARLAGFRELVIARHPELFRDDVVGKDPTISDELPARLPPWLASLDLRFDAMRALADSVKRDLPRFDQSFQQAFPDMRWDGAVFFTVSIDAFDGAVRKVDGKTALLFGIDKIALLHGKDANLAALFHHELFHLHHPTLCALPEPKPEGPNGLWPPLWTEGLAVYVSQRLNPKATLGELTLSAELVRATDERMALIAGELLQKLDDAREEDFRDFFLGAGQRPEIPKRSAYYVGYRVAASLARQMSFDRLVRLCGDELRTAIERELLRLKSAEPAAPAPMGQRPAAEFPHRPHFSRAQRMPVSSLL
ncbi:MAG: hypothetical protein U0263_06075 [Polyangiaceae bacterium]